MIRNIIYLNLDRRADRKNWFLEHMESAGVPMEIVTRVNAKDWQDYDSNEDTVKRMREDGFGLNYQAVDYRMQPLHRGEYAYIWGMSQCLLQAANNGGLTLIMHDDATLRSWKQLNDSLDLILIHHWKTRKLGNRTHLIQLSYNILVGKTRNATIPHDNIWNYGIQAHREDAIIYSPSGASRMLALIQGTHHGLYCPENILVEHFNNYHSFHPCDPRYFTHTLPNNIRDIKTDDMLK